MLHTNFCAGVGRYGAPLVGGCEGSAATIDERISFFAPDLVASGPDCARAELGKNAQASRQKQIVFFMALTTTAVAGSAENWSGRNAVQWTGSDNCLECLWPAKYRFRSRLQPKVARLVAENGARIAGSLRL